MLNFDNETGFQAQAVDDVRNDVRALFIEAFKSANLPPLNTDPSTPQGQLIDSLTASIVHKDSELLYLANQFNPLVASGIFQDALARIYFITRQKAIKSRCTCKATGRQGTKIPKGTLIQSEIDATQWQSLQDVEINKSGVAFIDFECLQEGAIQANTNTLTQIVTVVAGFDTVTNEKKAIVGRNAESQSEFEARRYLSVALNSRSTLASVYGRVGQVQGVLSLYVVENKGNVAKVVDGVSLNPHSVFVSVLGGNDLDVATSILNSVSAGCDFTGEKAVQVQIAENGALETVRFNRPTDYPLSVKATVRKNQAIPSNAEQLIKDAIYNNFYGLSGDFIGDKPILRAKQGDDLYSSRFYVSILKQGITEILSVQISLKSPLAFKELIHIPINKNPTLSKDDIQVIIQDV